jgi:hypothetical protein
MCKKEREMSRPDKLPLTVWFTIAAIITGLALAVLTLAGCQKGTTKPEPTKTTVVGPPGTGEPTLIAEDTTVVFPKGQKETDYAVAHGATWICGDGGMSYKKTPEACVGHGGPAEVIRK